MFFERLHHEQCSVMCQTLFWKQYFISMRCQVICVLNECIFDGADICVDTVSGAILSFDASQVICLFVGGEFNFNQKLVEMAVSKPPARFH